MRTAHPTTSAAGSIPSPTVQTAGVPAMWDRDADVVVIGAGAPGCRRRSWRGKPARRSFWSKRNATSAAMPSSAAATCRSAAAPARRRSTGSRIRPTWCSRISPTGRSSSPTAFPTIATTTARSFARSPITAPPTYDWLLEHGVIFADKAPDDRGGISVGNSAPREMHCCRIDWPLGARPASR